MHGAEVAGRVVIDDAARIELVNDGFRTLGAGSVARGPLVALGMQAVHHIGVHVLAVAGAIVAHGVKHDRRVIPGYVGVESGVLRVAVGLVGIGRGPFVMAEVGLRKERRTPSSSAALSNSSKLRCAPGSHP